MNVFNYFLGQYRQKSQIILLSWAYSIVTILFVLISGIIALIDQRVGVAFLIIPLISVVALCLNVVTWAMIRFVIETIELRKRAKKSTKKSK